MVRVQNCIRTASAAGGRRRKARWWWWLVCVTANPALSKNRCINFSSLTFGKTNPFLEKFLSQLQYRDYYVQLCVYSFVMQCIVYTYICHSFIIRHEEGMRVLNNKYIPMICPTFGTLENHKRIYVYCHFSFLCPVLCCIIYITQHKTIRHDTTQNGIVYFQRFMHYRLKVINLH